LSDDTHFDSPPADSPGTSQAATSSDRPAPETAPDGVRDTPQTSNNQGSTEPAPPSSASSAPDFTPGGQHQDADAANASTTGLAGGPAASEAARGSGDGGDGGAEPDRGGETRGAAVAPSALVEPPVPTPGDVNDEHGHIAVSTNAAQGTSEQLHGVTGIKTTSIAEPGKPDGEVST